MNDKEILNKLKYLIKKKKTFSNICMKCGLSQKEILFLVEKLKQEGELIDYINGELIRLKKPYRQNKIYQIEDNKEKIKLLLISDTHLGNKSDRLDILNYLYNKAEDSKIKYILHSGDFTDGFSGRIEHLDELTVPTYQEQVEYSINNYPFYSGKTYAIQGNHDDWWFKREGKEILKEISKQRKDIIYLGSEMADMKIGKLKIRLLHRNISPIDLYQKKKYLDTIPQDRKPDILQTGHIHQSFYELRDNTHWFQTGCLEDLTPYSKYSSNLNDKSVWWCNVILDDNGNVVEIKRELEEFTSNKVFIHKR